MLLVIINLIFSPDSEKEHPIQSISNQLTTLYDSCLFFYFRLHTLCPLSATPIQFTSNAIGMEIQPSQILGVYLLALEPVEGSPVLVLYFSFSS